MIKSFSILLKLPWPVWELLKTNTCLLEILIHHRDDQVFKLEKKAVIK